jgi:hypothetical protein
VIWAAPNGARRLETQPWRKATGLAEKCRENRTWSHGAGGIVKTSLERAPIIF